MVKIESTVVSETIFDASEASSPYFVANIADTAALGADAAIVHAIKEMPLIPNNNIIPIATIGISNSRITLGQ